MTGLTRQQAAEAVAALFGTTASHSRSSRTYDPWEVTDNEGKTWRFVFDASIRATHRSGRRQLSTGDDTYKVEMNSPKLEYSEMGKLQDVVRTLRHAGAAARPPPSRLAPLLLLRLACRDARLGLRAYARRPALRRPRRLRGLRRLRRALRQKIPRAPPRARRAELAANPYKSPARTPRRSAREKLKIPSIAKTCNLCKISLNVRGRRRFFQERAG